MAEDRVVRPNPASLFEVRGELAINGVPSAMIPGGPVRVSVILSFDVATDLWLRDQYRKGDDTTYTLSGPRLSSSDDFKREQARLKARGIKTKRDG
jgi:hypothetical protein